MCKAGAKIAGFFRIAEPSLRVSYVGVGREGSRGLSLLSRGRGRKKRERGEEEGQAEQGCSSWEEEVGMSTQESGDPRVSCALLYLSGTFPVLGKRTCLASLGYKNQFGWFGSRLCLSNGYSIA